MTTLTSRDLSLDIARGLGIVLVVFGHALRGLVSAGFVDDSGWSVPVDYLIYTFHMPLFFVISGLLFSPSVQGQRAPLGAFVTKILVLLAWPYLLWSLLQGGVQIALARGDAVNGNLSVSDLFQIYWKPFGQFWFLYAMFFAQLISFLVWRRVRPLLLVFAGLLTFLWAFYALPKTIMLVSYGLFYFFVGMMAREMKLLEHLGRTWPSVVGLLLAGALGAVFCYVAGVPSYLPIPAALLMVPAVLALSIRLGHALAGGRLVALLVTIGQCSMGIFILHILVIGAVRLAMTKFLKVSDPAVLLTVLTLSATLIPVAVQLVAVRLGIDKLVGLPSSVKRGRGVLRKDVVAG